MTFREAHWDSLDDSLVFSYVREDNSKCTNGKCRVFSFQYEEEDTLELNNGKCHLCTL